ncbi:hypothetical protein V8G61_12075 [Gaetbulibacter sp. M240]|uniref:hypothetical protein n=1 Tax=Gaetbulibacter sp. M240 TaxID=3126511 RepID=UPI00374ED5E1
MKSMYLKIVLIFTLLVFFNCKQKESDKDAIADEEVAMESSMNVVDIVTRGMDFQSVDTIPSGWNIFKYQNLSDQPHFFLLDQYPEGYTIQNTIEEVAPPFDKCGELIHAGKRDEGMAELANLPEWFGKIIFVGGSGLLSPKETSLTAVKLDPGYYIMECYVKMPEGKFHTSMGMAKAIIVTDKDSGVTPPEPTVNITISSEDGITYDKGITKGKQVFSVHFKDQIVHENFVGHDINLAKIEPYTDLDELEKWMDWSIKGGLQSPAPNGVTFLGGVNDMPEGRTGYFTVDLEPGNYVFISEVPNTKSKNLLVEFDVID